jgi:hypothetical protein
MAVSCSCGHIYKEKEEERGRLIRYENGIDKQ